MHLYKRITQAHEAFKVSIALFHKWPFTDWINFWITARPETIINVSDIKMAIRTRNLFTKVADASMVYECVIRDDYHLKGLKPYDGSFIIDVGGHIGSFSIAAAKLFPGVKVISFEPSPFNYKLLKRNIVLNKCKNIIAFNKAVTSHGKKVSLYLDKLNPAESSVYFHKNSRVEATSTTLEKIFKDFGIKKCVFVKMDCEGSEYDILLGTPVKILRKIGAMAIEYHDPAYFGVMHKDYKLPNLVKRMEKSGFVCAVKRAKGYQGVLFARRRK